MVLPCLRACLGSRRWDKICSRVHAPGFQMLGLDSIWSERFRRTFLNFSVFNLKPQQNASLFGVSLFRSKWAEDPFRDDSKYRTLNWTRIEAPIPTRTEGVCCLYRLLTADDIIPER